MLSYIGFSLKDIVCLKRIDFNDILSHLPQCIIYVKLYGKKCPLHISCFFQGFLSFKINMLESMAIYFIWICASPGKKQLKNQVEEDEGRLISPEWHSEFEKLTNFSSLIKIRKYLHQMMFPCTLVCLW